jgi:hypothetical protein
MGLPPQNPTRKANAVFEVPFTYASVKVPSLRSARYAAASQTLTDASFQAPLK